MCQIKAQYAVLNLTTLQAAWVGEDHKTAIETANTMAMDGHPYRVFSSTSGVFEKTVKVVERL